MAKSGYALALMLLVSVLSSGCDKGCPKTVEDVATIQNLTGKAIAIRACKGQIYGEVAISVPESSSANEISLGVREATEVRGGPGASCSDVKGGKTQMGISLAPSSFGQVKLCRNATTHQNVIVEIYENCPGDFLEQLYTGPCNS